MVVFLGYLNKTKCDIPSKVQQMLPNKFTSNPVAELLPFSLLSENLFGYIPGICAMNYQLIILQDQIEVTQTSSSNADEFSVASQLAAA